MHRFDHVFIESVKRRNRLRVNQGGNMCSAWAQRTAPPMRNRIEHNDVTFASVINRKRSVDVRVFADLSC